MATEADIPEPICETRMEQRLHIADQATSISNNKLPHQEKNLIDTLKEPPRIEGEDFLTTPSIDQVHSEVNKTSSDATEKPDHTEKDETVILLHRSPKIDHQSSNAEDSSERIQQNTEKSNVSDKDEDRGVAPFADLDDVRVETELSKDTTHGKTTEEDISGNLTSDESKEVECEDNKIPTEGVGLSNERDFVDSSEIVAEKPSQENSTPVEAITNLTSGDEQFEKENEEPSSEKVSTGGTDDNESTVIDKVIDDDKEEDIRKAELFEIEENISTLLKEDVDAEKSVESLHEVPEIIKASNLSEENKTASSPEEQSTDANQHGIERDDTEEKTIDAVEEKKGVLESFLTFFSSSSKEESITAESECTDGKTVDKVDTQKEIPEEFSTVVPNEEIENSNKVDGLETKDEETLVKESEEMPLPLSLATEANDIENGELRKTELCENGRSAESILLEIEPKIEKPEYSLNVVSGDIKEYNLDHEIVTRSYIQEQTEAAQPKADLDEKTDDTTLVAAETKEEILELQNVPTSVSDEKTEGDALIQADSTKIKIEDPLEKDDEEASLITDSIGNSNDDLITTSDEVKIDAKYPSREELLQEEKKYEHDLGQHTETAASLKEQTLTESPEEFSGDKTEEIALNAGDSNEKTQELQNVAIDFSNEENDKNSLIQVDTSQMKHDRALDKEIETPSLKEASTSDVPEENKESNLLKEELSQDAFKDDETSASNEDTEITSTLEEQSLTAIPQTIVSDKAIDSIGTKAEYIENVATEVPHEQMESKEHLEKETEISSDKAEGKTIDAAEMKEETVQGGFYAYMHNKWMDFTGKNNDEESTIIDEAKLVDQNSKAELIENEKTTESNLVEDEVSIRSLEVSDEDIKASASGQDREAGSLEEQGLTINPSGVIDDQKEDESADATETPEDKKVATTTLHEDTEKNTPIQVSCQIEQNEHLEKESENTSPTGEAIESSLKDDAVVEKAIESFEVVKEDTEAPDQIPTANPQEIACDKTEEKTSDEQKDEKSVDATETPEDKDVATTTLHEETEKNIPVQVSCQTEQNEHLEKESENTSPSGDTIESTLKDDIVVEKAIDSFEVVKEDIEASEQIPTANPQEISCDKAEEKTIDDQKEDKPVEAFEQIPTADPQEISCNKAEEKTIDDQKEDKIVEAVEQIPTADPQEISCDKADEKTIDDQKEDKSVEAFEHILTADPPETSCAKAEEKTIDDQKEDKSIEAAEQIPTADPQEISCDIGEEKTIDDQKEGNSVDATENPEDKKVAPDLQKESTLNDDAVVEKAIDSFEVVKEHIQASEQIPMADPREISCDKPEEKTIDDQKEDKSVDATETPEDKKVATTQHEDTEENTLAQMDCQMEQKEHLEKKSENTSPTGETEESTLKDDAVVEKAIESFEVVKEDTEASEQIPDKAEYKTIDLTYTEEQTLEVQDIVTNVPSGHNEYSSPIEEDDSQKSSSEAASRENANEDDSSIQYDAKFVDVSSTKADLYESAKSVEGNLLKEEAFVELIQAPAEDIKEPTSGQDTTDLKEETPEHQNISPAIPYEESEDVSLIQVHTAQMEQNEHTENESESSSLTEAPTGDTTESALLKEAHTEKPIDICQEADEDIKESSSIQETETTSIKEETITADAQKALGEKIKEESIDATDKEETLDVQDPEAITGEKYIQEELPTNVSRDVSESNGVNGEEETNSNDCEVISDSSNAVASEEDLTTSSFQENKREIHHEAETEEAQKQDDGLHVSALDQDSSMEEIEKDAQLSLASTDASDVTEEVKKLEEPSLSAPGDNITEKTDSTDSEVPEDATENKYIEHLEQENTTISLDDKKPTAIEQGETECEQVLLDETVEEINESVSESVANDFPPKSFTETLEVDHSTSERELSIDREELQRGNTRTGDDEEAKNGKDKSKEEEASEQKIPEENLTCKFTKEADTFLEPTDTTESTVINKSFITDIENKVDNEAPEIIQTAPSATEGQEVESIYIQETPALASQLEKGEHEYEFIGNVKVLAEKSGPNVVRVAPEENKSEYESKNQGLESIAQVQSCDIIPKATEMELEEENIETAAEINSEDVLAEDIYAPEGTPYENESMKVDISSEKFEEEDEHLEDYHGSRKDEVITERCLNDEVKQEEVNTEEIFEDMNHGKETEKVSEVSEETDDKAVEEQETNSLANESLDSLKELGKSDEETILHTEEVKRSTTAVLEDENNRTGAAEVKMVQEDGPLNLQNARGISENVQELNEGCVEVSNKENPVEVDPIENIEAKVSSEEQEAEKIQKAVVSETLNQETEEQQRGSTSEVVLKAEEENCEEDNIIDNECNDLIEKENSSSGAADKVSEFNVHQNSVEDIAQSDKNEETERKIDSLTILPHVKCSDIETTESVEKSESKEVDNRSLLDLLQDSTKKTSEVTCHSAIGEDTTIHKEETQPEKTDEAEHEDVKTDEEKDDEDESSEQRRSELGCEAPVMVDMGDADMKSPHKKSHNILSGVGSKMKHSIAKVKKAITGKSSHPKPPSPK